MFFTGDYIEIIAFLKKCKSQIVTTMNFEGGG